MNPLTHPSTLPYSTSTAIKAVGLTALVLALSCIFGSDTQRRVASLVLAAPVVLVLSLLTLAASNVAFSILYARRHRPALQSHGYHHHNTTTPGQASRHLFHHLRPAKFTLPVAWSNIEKRRRQEQAAKYRVPIADTMPQFSEAVDQVIELIIRDYVAGWMRAITPEVVLQQRIEELLRIVLLRLKARVMDLDLTQLLVTRLVPKVTAHVSDFRKAEMALRGNSLERSLTESDELDLMVAGKFRNGKLHRALSTSISTQASEEAYLRNVVQTILPMLLPKSEVQSEILRHLLRELLVGAVLRPVLDLLSDPDYWNQNVDLYIGKAIQEQNMVKKLREALKQHTDNMAESGLTETPADVHGSGADLYSFEDFLTMIKRCDSLLDVKRIRNTIITQMRKKRALIANREKDDIVNGNKVEDIVVYINRLELAKRRAEKRIEALGGPAYPKRNAWDHTPEVKNAPSLIPLDIILTNPSGLSYFMEFQDRRDNMNELQFWLLIDTLNIKGDTESRADDDLATEKSTGSTSSSTLSKATSKRTDTSTTTSTQAPNDSVRTSNLTSSILNSRKNSIATTIDLTDTLREDVRMIYDTYFASSAPRPVVVDHNLVDVFREFALADGGNSKLVGLSDSDMRKQEEAQAFHMRQQLLSAQRQVFDQMVVRDYPSFVKTDLYFKFLATYHNSLQESKDEAENGSRSPSSHRLSPGPALFSAMGLTSPDKRHDPSENPKRSSTGSFLDIFGLGRDKDKDKDRDRGNFKRTETTLGNFRPGFLTPSSSRSKPGSPVSMRASESGASSQNSLQQLHRHQLSKPKQSLEVAPASAHSPPLLSRSRSLSSISNPENSTGSAHRRGVSAAGGTRDNSLDQTSSERMTQSAIEEGRPTLRNSLLLELQEHGDDDETDDDEEEDQDGGEKSRGGMPIPRMLKKKKQNGNEDVIDAVEAVLTSIMETHNTPPQDMAESGVKEKATDSTLVDVTDPSFSTARDGHTGANALLEWGQGQGQGSRRRFKESSLESGKTVRVSNRDLLGGNRVSLDSVFGPRTESLSEKNTLRAISDDEGSARREKLMSPGVTPNDSDSEVITQSKAKAKRVAADATSESVQDDVHLAAPGDLLIATKIELLEQDIKMLRKQEAILEAMIHKVERQNRPNQLRLLKKSKSDLRRDILNKEYQKTQYEVQEEENMIMPGRSTISITSSTVSHDGSKEFALYEIQVFQLDQDGSCASGWVIARRYSEFFALHQQLKEKFPSIVRQYELPGKRGFLKLQKSFVENRRIGLERYLQSLIRHAEICQSQELRAFLSKENVALPQFTASTPAIMPYSFFTSDNNSNSEKGGEAKATPLTPSNPFSFEQLFHSSTSPLHSPVASRDPIKSQLLSNHGSEIIGNGAGNHRSAGESGMDPDEGIIKHIYQTLSEGLDDMFSGGPPTVLGNISKQLGDQMMLSMEAGDDERGGLLDPGNTGPIRKRHGSHGENGSVRLSYDENPMFTASQQPKTGGPERPPLQRIHSSRNRRLSSPDPHTQHQRLQLQKQQLEVQQQMMPRQEFQPERQQQQQQHPRPSVVEPEGVTTFTEPLCDLFIELFELKQKNNWLRRQAVVIILQQVLGGAIERKLRDTIKAYMEENMLTFYVSKLREVLWPPSTRAATDSPDLAGYEIINQDLSVLPTLPGLGTKSPSPSSSTTNKNLTRTQVQKAATKDQASRKLSVFLPELLGNMVGQQNARRGARRVFAAFQNRRLNQQLMYTTLDEVISAMWPELAGSSSIPSPAEADASLKSTTGHHGSSAATTSMTNTTASVSTSTALPPNAGSATSPIRHPSKSQPATDASDSSDLSAAPSSSKTRTKSDARYRRR
ncbi:Intermediate filament protein [Mortierella alpina]|nr:Intermediate filament protein [Mortierella alpina]